jgi:hypothetical protein
MLYGRWYARGANTERLADAINPPEAFSWVHQFYFILLIAFGFTLFVQFVRGEFH